MLVVEKHRAGPEKCSVLDTESVKDERAVLELAEVADMHVLVDVDAFADDAMPSDHGALTHLRLVPYLRPFTELRVCRDIRCWMYVDGAFLHRALILAFRPLTLRAAARPTGFRWCAALPIRR